MRITFILILFNLLFHFTVSAQGFKSRFYPTSSLANSSKAVYEIDTNEYLSAGFSINQINGENICQIVMMGLNGSGTMQWSKKYGQKAFYYVNNPFNTRCFYRRDSSIYFAGFAVDTGSRYVGVLIKFNLDGDTIWQKVYRDTDPLEDVMPQMVAGSVDGGFLLTGFIQNWSSNSYRKCLIIKSDANGNELWRKKIGKGPPEVSDGKAIIQDSLSKKILIVGYQYKGVNSDNYDHILILDSLGNKLVQKSFSDSGGGLYDVVETKDKKYVAVGRRYHSEKIGGTNPESGFAVKFDINSPANYIWRINDYDKKSFYNLFSCAVLNKKGELIIGGALDTFAFPTNGISRYILVDNSGNVIQRRTYDYKKNSANKDHWQGTQSIEITNNNGFVVSLLEQNPQEINPFFFVKYDSTWCDSSLAYCSSISTIAETVSYDQLEIFPSPVSDELRIHTGNALAQALIKMEVVNSLGQIVQEKTIDNGTGAYSINVGMLPEGFYLLRVILGDRIVCRPVLIAH
jgi:hypothetical protein